MLPPSDPPALALVSTVHAPGPLLEDFVAWHRAIGFARLYLVFDDPSDPDLERARSLDGVVALPCDAAMRAAWPTTSSWAEFGSSTDAEVMSRQILNAAVVLERARSEGAEWLLHLDIDELFLPPAGDARAWFATLGDQPVDVLGFPNLEAVPESDACERPFREVTLFKVPVARMAELVAPDPALADRLRRSDRFGSGFFNLYSNGKAAVRLSTPATRPEGVHDFGSDARPLRKAAARNAFILHYACCGLKAFTDKYRRLGRFDERWWGRFDIRQAIGPFHLEARDVVAGGDADRIRDFYDRRVAMKDPGEVEAWSRARLLERIGLPGSLLADR